MVVALFACVFAFVCSTVTAHAVAELVSLKTLQVPIEGGSSIVAEISGAAPRGLPITCNIAWRMDAWMFAVPSWNASIASNIVTCAPMPSVPAEGPVDFYITIGDHKSNKLLLWTFATFSASFGMTPYFGAFQGHLLVRINDTGICSGRSHPLSYHLYAAIADSGIVLLDNVKVLGSDLKRAVPISFQGLNATLDTVVNLTLSGVRSSTFRLQVRLVRVASTRVGAVSVDHRTRSLLVDGHPFFPISWMTDLDSHGIDVMASTMAQMAQRGANSIMIYGLGDVAADLAPKAVDSFELVHLMDVAQAVGLKMQLDIRKLVTTMSKTGGSKIEWTLLEKFVQKWQHHPALLAWYVADDSASKYMPLIYDRIKQLDPYHIVTLAKAGIGDAFSMPYLRGADVVMPENYPQDASSSWDTMHVLSYFPYDWAPRVTCAIAWPSPVTPTALFRAQLYNSLAAGATGDIWFAERTLLGEWSEPGPLFDASGVLAKEILELVPSLLVSEIEEAQPTLVSVDAMKQDGTPGDARAFARRESSGCIHLFLVNNLNVPTRVSVQFDSGTPGIYDSVTSLSMGIVPFEKSLPNAARLVHIVNGSLSEWLPSWGTQVFRFNGTSDCAHFPSTSVAQSGNCVMNPSFELSSSYAAAPDSWTCGVDARQDRACFADSSDAKVGRRSGRFASGSNFGTFRVRVPIKGCGEERRYKFSARVRGDCDGQVVTLKSTFSDGLLSNEEYFFDEQDIAFVVAGGNWTRLEADIELRLGRVFSFAISKPGVLWIDDVSVSVSLDTQEHLQPPEMNVRIPFFGKTRSLII